MTSRTNFCKALGYLWLVASGLIVLIGIVGVWITEGVAEIPGHLSPFHTVNWIVMMIAVVPGVCLLMLAARLREQVENSDGVVRVYGKLLQETVDALVLDEKRLPTSKQEVKVAILEALENAREPKRRAFLQNAYLDLAMFQPGVGPEPIRFESSPGSSARGYKTVVAVASSIAKRHPEIKYWSEVVAKESAQLLGELRAVGFGSDAKVGDTDLD